MAVISPAAISVEEALDLDVLRRGAPVVLAGGDLLDRQIRWVHAGEVPNIANLLRGGELLLTTGMGIGKQAGHQRRYVEQLAERRIAALVLELGSAVSEVPAVMRETAEALQLPLVVLRQEVRFVEVTEAIHTELINRQFRLVQRGQEIERRLIEAMLAGDGIPEVLDLLARQIDATIFLENAEGRLLFHSGGPARQGWEQIRRTTDDDPNHIAADVPMGQGDQSGRLVAVGNRQRFSELDEVGLRRTAGVIALALLRARQEEELFIRERGNVLSELLANRLSGVEAERQASLLGFEARSGVLMPVAVDTSENAGDVVWSAVLHESERALSARGVTALLGARANSGQLMGMVALRRAEDRDQMAEQVAATITERAEHHARSGAIVAVGMPTGWGGASSALELTSDAAACARYMPSQPWFDADALELQLLMWRLRKDHALTAFVERKLGPLLEHDRTHRLALRPTLEVLCARGGHKAESARELHLNRQALYHRIARLEELLGVDVSEPTQLVTLQMALEATRYVTR